MRSVRSSTPTVRLVPAPESPPQVFEPDVDQQRVLETLAQPGHGPVAVLAGPGTGKTATIVEAVARRIESGTDPARICVLTFSRRAAGELRDRIARRLAASARATAVGASAWTFHAFCYAVVRAAPDPGDSASGPRDLRLVSGPEQDVIVRDLLLGHLDEGFVSWPAQWREALPTRGFADELRGLFATARSFGLSPADLAAQNPAWTAAAEALAEYLDVMDAAGAIDYSELIRRAVSLATLPEAAGGIDLASRFDLVVVDEYQDTDPAQERLLAAMAGAGRDLVVVGDPDQSIYAFRGADQRCLADFPDRFRGGDGGPARVLALRTCRRSGAVLLDAARRVVDRLPVDRVSTGSLVDHRQRVPAAASTGSVEVRVHRHPVRAVDDIVDLVRRARLGSDPVPWSEIAVISRTAGSLLPLRRALTAAGVPVEVAADEIPVAHDPALAPLLLALTVALAPEAADADDIRALLLSPWCAADAARLRRLGRALRAEVRDGLSDDQGPGDIPSSHELLRAAVLEPARLVAHDPADAAPLRRLSTVLAAASAAIARGAGPHEVLWLLWQQQPWRDDGLPSWAERLERAALRGGDEGRRADRDLDAVVALFELAARSEQRVGRSGVGPFLDQVRAQQIPADTLAERAVRGDGVRLLTAHRAKGLEWSVVIVTDVHEEVWPDLRRRGSMLDRDRIGPEGPLPAPPASVLLAEERRLFYVAITRAKERLVVVAVDSGSADGPRPSRFLDDLSGDGDRPAHTPTRPLTPTALVADLRAALTDPDRATEEHAAAAMCLAALADTDGEPVTVGAHPDEWWGTDEPTTGDRLYPDDRRILLSGSGLESLASCPLQWFLDRQVHGASARGSNLGFGSVIHALAQDLLERGGDPDAHRLLDALDTAWGALEFDAPWVSAAERLEAEQAVHRLVRWHQQRSRTPVGAEVVFSVDLTVGGREVVVRGSMDRVEVDAEGRVHVVDFKTGKGKPTAADVAGHVQLATYQLAVREGALAGLPDIPDGAVPGGAELVHLRQEFAKQPGLPVVQIQPALDARDSGDSGDSGTDGAGGVADIDAVVAEAVRVLVEEDLGPDPVNGRCQYCAFITACPAQDAGQGVIA